MKTCCYLLMLCLTLVFAVRANAIKRVPVTSGALTITGQMYVQQDPPDYNPETGEYVVEKWWPLEDCPFYSTKDSYWRWYYEGVGDPQNYMFYENFQIGVRRSGNIPIGTYEQAQSLPFLGNRILGFNFTVTPTTVGTWRGSENLRLELLSGPWSDEVFWWTYGPFSSEEPLHVHLDLEPDGYGRFPGSYGFRLTVVPEVSPFISLLSGLGLLAYIRRRRV